MREYDPLLPEFLDFAVKSGFITPVARRIVVTATSAKELLDEMERFEVAEGRIVTASPSVGAPADQSQGGD